MVVRGAWAVLLVLACVTQGAARAHAQVTGAGVESSDESEAKLTFTNAKQAFEAGRFTDALAGFRRAYALSGRSELLFNIGLAADRLREDQLALDSFERFLREQPDSIERSNVAQRVVALRASLARHDAQPPVPRAAPSPAQTAASADHDDTQRTQPPDAAAALTRAAPDARDHDDSSVFEQWWFWTGAALLVGGGVTAALVLSQHAAKPESTLAPNSGIVVMTLGHGP